MMTPTQIDDLVQSLLRRVTIPPTYLVDEAVLRRKAALRWLANMLPSNLDDNARLVFVWPDEVSSYLCFLGMPDERAVPRMTYLTMADLVHVMAKLSPPEDDDKVLSINDVSNLRRHFNLLTPWE